MLTQLSENLCLVGDLCNIYAITAGGKCLLIDCGTSTCPEERTLQHLGPVTQILLTHFHRDQCDSAPKWQRAGAALSVPYAERKLFEESDLNRASYDIYDNYSSLYVTHGPLEDVRADSYVHDYETIRWEGIDFEVVPLPGHTFGSVGYLFNVDGRRYLACGDLLCAPGKVQQYWWTQWHYMGFGGHINTMESLKLVEELGVDVLLPGHGQPFEATGTEVSSLRRKYEKVYELVHGRPYEYWQPEFKQITPHVIMVANTGARTYLVRDDAGNALCIDCGYPGHAPITRNPHRAIDQLTDRLESELGIQNVEWFLCSHHHDDHLAGLSFLRRRYGTKVACCPELKEILEHPERYDMPCLLPEGFDVDAVVPSGKAFTWRGIDFHMEHQPGQTLYHQTIWFEVDDKRFLVTGDNITGMSFGDRGQNVLIPVPKNRTPLSAKVDIARRMIQIAPDYMLMGHAGVAEFDQARAEQFVEWMQQWSDVFADIIDQPCADMGKDPHWVEFSPYKVRIGPGQSVQFQVTVTNHEPIERQCLLRFRSVDGVTIEPDACEMTVPARSRAVGNLKVMFPETFKTHSLPILADVTWDGRELGEIAEAIAYW